MTEAAGSTKLEANQPESGTAHVCDLCGDELEDELNRRADVVLRELLAGRADEAELLCRAFINDYPDEAEGLDLLSMIFEERGTSPTWGASPGSGDSGGNGPLGDRR